MRRPTPQIKSRSEFRNSTPNICLLHLAEKRGFFREDGLQGEVIRINPTVALAALVSGELDYWTVIGNSVGAAIPGSSAQSPCLLRAWLRQRAHRAP